MSIRNQLTIKKWGRTVTFLDGEAGMNFPADSLNAKLHGLTYKPRDGYNEVAVTPSGPGDTYNLLGLGHVIDEDDARPNYFLSVEDRTGTIKAYKIDEDTLERELTPLTSADLHDGNWLNSQFNTNAYLINPSGTKRVYRHVAGSSTLQVVEDTAYVATSDPDLTITPRQLDSRGWDAGDTWTYTSTDGILAGASFNAASGIVTMVASDNDNGNQHRTQFQSVFAASQDWTKYNYLSFQVVALNPGSGGPGDGSGIDIFNAFERTNIAPEIKSNGVWHTIASTDFKEFFNPGNSEVTIAVFIKGLADIDDIEAVRFTVGGNVNRFGSPNACTINPIKLGGVYLESTVSTNRLWDGNLEGDGITYGVRYKKAGPLYSPLKQSTVTAGEGRGFVSGCPLGAKLALSTTVATAGGYTDVEFIRLLADGETWKVIGTVANTGTPQIQDPYEENELAALTTAPDISDDPIIPTPPFSTNGVRFAFPFKQSMIWLTSGGIGNIHISRVGDPEEIYDSERTYDDDDLTQPSQRTLADNQADQPVWGVQAGANAFIVGEKAAYALQGDFPVTLSPSRQIPGSRGIAGPYAGCRFRPTTGEDGAAYLDNEGNVWLVNSVPEYTDDTRAKPFELSSLVRHKIKQFLLTEQRGEFPELSIEQAQLEFQEATSSLWVVLGKRAAVYRQDESGSGWEFYEYQLTTPPGSSEISTCRAYSAGTASPESLARPDSTHPWDDPAYGAVDDTNEASAGEMSYGDKTELLRSVEIKPSVLLPLSATLNELHLRIRHRKQGDIQVFHDWTKLCIDGTPTGANLATNEELTEDQTTVTYDLTSGLPTVEEINSGKVGFETAYVAEDGNPEWNDPDNYEIDVVMDVPEPDPDATSLDATATITVDYTGPGAPPPSVDLDINAYAWVNAALIDSAVPEGDTHFRTYVGEGTITDGLGNSNSGSIYETESTEIEGVEISNSELTNVVLSAGHASFTLTSTGTMINSAYSQGTDVFYEVTAAMHPKDPSTVFVDSMEISACFTISASSPGADSGISWQRLCFTPDSKYLAGRSSGQLDIVEYDFRNGSFIDGNGRDGGYQMPDWSLTLERLTFEGRTARLNGVQVNTLDPTDAFMVEARLGNQPYQQGTPTGTATSRWVRFPVTQIGLSHQIKIAGDESVHGIDGLAIEYQPTSRRKRN